MAEITYSITTRPRGTQLVTWSGVTESDTFQQYTLDGPPAEISCHITGTFGSATVVMQGGNVDSEMLDLVQIGGSAASATSADIFSLLDRPLYIQPSHSGGTSESVTVYMLVRN